MRSIFAWLAVAGLSFVGNVVADEADESPSVPLGTPPLGEQLKHERDGTPPRAYSFNPAPNRNPMASVAKIGQPENRWRYRYANGRWWYWTRDNQWSYFDGNRWTAYRPAGDFLSRKVDPALLRLEAKEGTLGYKRWQHSGGQSGRGGAAAGSGGGGWAISGTRGSIGGAPSGAWTFSPSTPNDLNTNPAGTLFPRPAQMGGVIPRSGAPGTGIGGAGTGR